MKKIWRLISTILLIVAVVLTGVTMGLSHKNNASAGQDSMFVMLEGGGAWDQWKIVYHKDTKVMYAVSVGVYNQGTFTLLVDKDGKPMLYQE